MSPDALESFRLTVNFDLHRDFFSVGARIDGTDAVRVLTTEAGSKAKSELDWSKRGCFTPCMPRESGENGDSGDSGRGGSCVLFVSTWSAPSIEGKPSDGKYSARGVSDL